MQKIFDVVVIGAGISGIAAALELSKAQLDYLILEGRDRIGGRINSQVLDGITVNTGASFVHYSSHNNPVAQLMKDLNWKSYPSNIRALQYFYEGEGELNQKRISQVEEKFIELDQLIINAAQTIKEDLPISQVSQGILGKLCKQNEQMINLLRWNLLAVANIAGAELNQISVKSYTKGEGDDDILPQGGYKSLIDKIVSINKPSIHLNQKVTKIDFSENIIKIYTKDQTYLAKKVISSLPLGVLQRGVVEFIPNLPHSHKEALSKIGNCCLNKIFVSFQKPFWDTKKSWLNFISKGEEYNKYPKAKIISDEGKNILCFFISGQANMIINESSEEEIQNDLVNFLQRFNLQEKLVVRGFKVTRWHQDEFSLGSYSYLAVRVTAQDFKDISSPICGKMWFIGEHCHPTMSSYASGAFETGVWAAKQIIEALNDQN